ncbi:MAG: RNA polymerase sporulation sigma factor SigK [Clostridia bacterium]
MLKKIKLFLLKIKILFRVKVFLRAKNIVMYVCGNEALPTPLDTAEEQILLEELACGNKQAKERLVEHNLRLVVHISKKFENAEIPLEDLISVGAIGLIKAVDSYKLDKKIKLATYASRCIENEILMLLRKKVRLGRETSLDCPISSDGEGNELSLADVMPSENESPIVKMEKLDEKDILWQTLNSLGRREREIMLLRFGLAGQNEKTQKEVADELGISQSYISRIEKKILFKMKKDLEKASSY